MIAALLLLLVLGAVLLVLVPRQSKLALQRGDVMTRFMERDYVCCDLAKARSTRLCEETLGEVARFARGEGGPRLAAAAGSALARCPAADLLAFAGDPQALRQPVPFLALKLQAADGGAARRAVRLLVSDPTLVYEVAQGVLHGRGPICWGATPNPESPLGSGPPSCPGAPKLEAEARALLADEKEEPSDRQNAAALLDELGRGQKTAP
jgi:hypothetical protein